MSSSIVRGGPPAVASVIVPAHNEASVIDRLLRQLLHDGHQQLDIIVVCNGCSDDTAQRARAHGSDVRVIELAEASKWSALKEGDAAATAFPRLYIDADVEISARSVTRLVEVLRSGDLLAVGPARTVPRDGVSRIVRWYYDVWEQLPQVQSGLFGRGVVGITEAGYERLRNLPRLMGDDLAASEAFRDHERGIVNDAVVVVYPPRTIEDLYRRRVRTATGNHQADTAGVRRAESSTSLRSLLRLCREQPRLAPKLPIFLAVGIAGRVGARRAIRRNDHRTWLRDESSRA